MNILFLTMNPFTDIEMHNIYSDLMKIFIENGHRPYIVTPREKKSDEKTEVLEYEAYSLLKVKIGNTSNVSLIEKGLSTLSISHKFYKAILKELTGINFDLILYSTPPITLAETISKLKRRYKCKTYLMLKDIFPQNAVDLGMFSERGFIYKYFRGKEKKLYAMSDYIGCMSEANVKYLQDNNPQIDKHIIGICPNGIIPNKIENKELSKQKIRAKYDIPQEATVYIYGGNLGKPQGIPFLIDCLKENIGRADCFFIICGSGSEYHLIENFIENSKPSNIRLINFLPKIEYDELVAGCDVGLIFLDARFTIPNYPSRILSYMENEMPVIVCADSVTDIGTDAEKNGYGFYCLASNPKDFASCVNKMNNSDTFIMGKLAREYLEKNFSAERIYRTIIDAVF